MNRSTSSIFEIYEETYAADMSDTERAGRYGEQINGEKLALLDIIEKLKFMPSDTFLDIGSGPGNFLIPISFLVAQATAVDNAAALDRAKARFPAENVNYISGSFPNLRPNETYSRVLIYSVLHCLSSQDKVREFVFAALDCLDDGGRMLLGDLPNSDLKNRFLKSQEGKKFDAEWRASRKPMTETVTSFHNRMAETGMIGTFDDAFLLSLVREIREKGFHAYLSPQKPEMPFGNTREEIIVVKPA